jgi:hypothetical protein
VLSTGAGGHRFFHNKKLPKLWRKKIPKLCHHSLQAHGIKRELPNAAVNDETL